MTDGSVMAVEVSLGSADEMRFSGMEVVLSLWAEAVKAYRDYNLCILIMLCGDEYESVEMWRYENVSGDIKMWIYA